MRMWVMEFEIEDISFFTLTYMGIFFVFSRPLFFDKMNVHQEKD